MLVDSALAGCRKPPPPVPPAERTYLERRATFHTNLLHHGPSPQAWQDQAPPQGVREVRYRSGKLDLKAWLRVPSGGPARAPAVVYFHGGYSFGTRDSEDALPLSAQRVLMCHAVWSENGNPGAFEMFFGEVDDARAAVRWLADQPFVDPDRISTLGDSAGGILSALLSLYDDVPIRHGGSAGGIYDCRLFHAEDGVPFDADDPEECRMRTLVGNIAGCVDAIGPTVAPRIRFKPSGARRQEAGPSSQLILKVIPGDHATSLPPAVEEYAGLLASEG